MDVAARIVRLRDGSQIPYDRLVCATGSTNDYFGNPALADHTLGLNRMWTLSQPGTTSVSRDDGFRFTAITIEMNAMNDTTTNRQTIFVAGATGVIGRRVVPLLVAAGHRVTGVARTVEKRAALERAGARAVQVDLFDSAAVRRVVQRHKVVINLATHIPPSARAFVPGAWRETGRIRRLVSTNLAEAALAANAARFIQESFAPIYEDAGDDWIDEDAPVRVARYNRTVLDAEAAAARFTEEGGAGIVLRFAYFYGADSDFTRDAVRYVRRGRAPVFGAPSAFISSVSHDDAAAAVLAALGLPAGRYNVSDDRPVRKREFADALAATVGVSPPKFFPGWVAALAGSLGETLARSQRISNARLRTMAGWTPRYPSVIEGWPAVVARLAHSPSGGNGASPVSSQEDG